MARLYLWCKDKNYPKGDWELTLGKGRVRLTDPAGYVVADFDRADAEKRFQFPSFWMSIKKLGVNTDDKKVIWFEPEKENISEIKRYLEYALASQGDEAIASKQWKGWGMVFGGTALLIVGLVLIIWVLRNIVDSPERRTPIGGAIVIMALGGSILGGGITSLARAKKAKTEWTVDEGESI